MKKILVALAAFALSFTVASAQSVTPQNPLEYNWPAATAVGVVGGYLVLDTSSGPPSSYTVDTYATGTVPSVCTFEVQSSPDGVTWNTGTASLSGDVSCGSATTLTYSFSSKPVRYLRIKLGTLTGADGTTHIFFFFTRAR